MCVHIAANYWVPQCLHVNTKLVGAASDWFEFYQSAVIATLDHLKISERMLASLVTNDLLRTIWPVCCDGQLY